MKNNSIKMFLFILFMFIGITLVKAEDSCQVTMERFMDSGVEYSSTPCLGASECATELFNPGLKITLVDENINSNTPVAGTKSVYFWPNETYRNYSLNGHSFTGQQPSRYLKESNRNDADLYKNYYGQPLTGGTMSSYINNNNSDVLPGVISSDYDLTHTFFKEYLSRINADMVANIIEKLKINNSGLNIKDTYYLKLEPIYIIRHKSNNNLYYYAGTTKEILDLWGDSDAWAYSPNWGVIRTYIEALVYPSSYSNGPRFPKYDGNLDSQDYSKLTTYKNKYKNSGLGVSYLKVLGCVDDCPTRANALTGNRQGLTALYFEYLSQGENYTNLLNFNSPACTANTVCDSATNVGVGCFSGNVTNSGAPDDLSCYNTTVNAISSSTNLPVVGYCLANLNTTNSLGQNSFSGISGQMLIKEEEFSKSQISMYCAFPESVKEDSLETENNLKTPKYVQYSLENTENDLNNDINYNETIVQINNENNSFYTITLTSPISFSKKYTIPVIGTLIPNHGSAVSYIDLGYGFVTKFTSEDGEIKFKYKFLALDEKEGTCDYDLTPKVIDPPTSKINMEFRIIDTSNPFTGKDGINRETNTNWCGKNNLNADSCAHDNSTVQTYILNANNSYNKNRADKPLYKIELNASDIKLIREYNKNNKYDNYEVVNIGVGGNTEIVNKFLNELKNGNLNGTNISKLEINR